MPPFTLAFILATAVYASPAIAAPWTNATCIAEPWSFNSRTQSPCLIAAYLCAACNSDDTCEIYSLRGTGGTYSISPSSVSSCVCNSVMWNLISACALCQRELPGNWAQWREVCPDRMVTIGKYPALIPADIKVPSWAYYDFTINGVFNPVTASQLFGPESSAISGATNTRVPVPSTTSTETSNVSRTSTNEPSSNTSAIVGGVVGGILGIGLIALAGFLLTRKRKDEDPATNYSEANHKPATTAQFNSATLIVEQASAYQLGSQLTPTSEYKPYNPNDPSTFPTTPVMHAHNHDIESIPYSYQPQGVLGQQPYPNIPQV